MGSWGQVFSKARIVFVFQEHTHFATCDLNAKVKKTTISKKSHVASFPNRKYERIGKRNGRNNFCNRCHHRIVFAICLTMVFSGPSSSGCSDRYILVTMTGHTTITIKDTGTQVVNLISSNDIRDAKLWHIKSKRVHIFEFMVDQSSSTICFFKNLELYFPEYEKSADPYSEVEICMK